MSLAQNAAAAPPLAHAIGGSLGSAFALMLLYPLERAKIEMQAQASQPKHRRSFRQHRRPQHHLPSTIAVVERKLDNQVLEVEDTAALADSPASDGGSSFVFVEDMSADDDNDDVPRLSVQLNVSDHSQVHIQPSSSSSTTTTRRHQEPMSEEVSVSVRDTNDDDSPSTNLGLVSCLAELWERGELYRGITPVVSTIGISNFIFFYVNEFMKKLFFGESSSGLSKQRKLSLSLLASSLAGVANVLATNPLWVANLRVISGGRKSRQSSVWLEMIRIGKVEGILQLWNGTLASLLLISNPVIQFFCYDLLKNGRIAHKIRTLQLLSQSKKASSLSLATAGRLSPWEAFLLGAIAKAISTVLTYPLQLAQAVLRLQQKPTENQRVVQSSISAQGQQMEQNDGLDPVEYRGTMDCLSKLYNSGGMECLFTGLKAKLLQTVLTAAFTFLTYEQIVQAIQVALRARESQGIKTNQAA